MLTFTSSSNCLSIWHDVVGSDNTTAQPVNVHPLKTITGCCSCFTFVDGDGLQLSEGHLVIELVMYAHIDLALQATDNFSDTPGWNSLITPNAWRLWLAKCDIPAF